MTAHPANQAAATHTAAILLLSEQPFWSSGIYGWLSVLAFAWVAQIMEQTAIA